MEPTAFTELSGPSTEEAPRPSAVDEVSAAGQCEAKVLDIDPGGIAERISRAGGRYVADRHLRRRVYSMQPDDRTRWVRLCDSGNRVTLCANELSPDGTASPRKAEVVVNDFDAAHALLERMGFTARAYQENRRSSWLLENVLLEIDTWPLIPPFLWLEGKSAAEVGTAADRLGLPRTSLTHEGMSGLYARYGIERDSLTDLCFAREAGKRR